MKPKQKTLIGPRVRALREQRRLTQKQLADALGITQGYLSLLERGRGSFTAEQLLTVLRRFNVPLDYFFPRRQEVGGEIQNVLAREGAGHLAESQDLLPSEKLRNAYSAIKEALVSADSARQIAAIAPVFVAQAGSINLGRLRNELAELGLEHRFGWAIESTLEAIKAESQAVLPRDWRIRYRRAETIIQSYIAPFIILSPTENPESPAPYDVLDPEIVSRQTLDEVIESLSPLARKWKVATRIEIDDFVRALRTARGAD